MKLNDGLIQVIAIAREWAALDPTGNAMMVEALKRMDAEAKPIPSNPEYDRGFENGLRAGQQDREVLLGVIENHQFSLTCCECDADGPDSRSEAMKARWTDIVFDNGPSWNFIGRCPECAKKDVGK